MGFVDKEVSSPILANAIKVGFCLGIAFAVYVVLFV